jgi:hypothetical protein
MSLREYMHIFGAIKLGRNPMASRTYEQKSINEYEIWLKGAMDMWTEYYIYEYKDGSAARRKLRGPFTEKEYFKLKLQGTM